MHEKMFHICLALGFFFKQNEWDINARNIYFLFVYILFQYVLLKAVTLVKN